LRKRLKPEPSSLKYQNRIGVIDLGVQYKFAGDQNGASAGSGYVAMLGYSAGALAFEATYSQTKNTVAWAIQYSNVTPPNPYLQIENTKGYMLTALWKITPAATVKAGWEDLELSAPSNPYLTGIQDYYGLLLPKPAQNATGVQYFQLYWLGGDYRFTPAFDAGIGFYDINTFDSPEIGRAYVAQAYSLLADYSLTKRFDAYLGAMLMRYSGVGLDKRAPVDAYSGNAMCGVGIRFRF